MELFIYSNHGFLKILQILGKHPHNQWRITAYTIQYTFLLWVCCCLTLPRQTGESVGFRVKHYQEVLRLVLLWGSPGDQRRERSGRTGGPTSRLTHFLFRWIECWTFFKKRSTFFRNFFESTWLENWRKIPLWLGIQFSSSILKLGIECWGLI